MIGPAAGWSGLSRVFDSLQSRCGVLSLFLVQCVGVEVLNQTQHDDGGGGGR